MQIFPKNNFKQSFTFKYPLITLQLHYGKAQAGMFSTTFEIGGVVGSAVIGIVLDRYHCHVHYLKGFIMKILSHWMLFQHRFKKSSCY